MFPMTPSELRIRMLLALGFLIAGLWVARSKAAELPGTGVRTAEANPPAISFLVDSGEIPRMIATDPARFETTSGQYQIVEFFAPWDPVSRDSIQLMESFEEKYGDQIRFSYLDVSDPWNAAHLENLNALFYPQFVFLDGEGHILHQWTTPSATEMDLAIAKANLIHPRW